MWRTQSRTGHARGDRSRYRRTIRPSTHTVHLSIWHLPRINRRARRPARCGRRAILLRSEATRDEMGIGLVSAHLGGLCLRV